MKAKEAIAKIEDIMGLEYDGFGEPMHPMDRMIMVNRVIHRYDKSRSKKAVRHKMESKDASS